MGDAQPPFADIGEVIDAIDDLDTITVGEIQHIDRSRHDPMAIVDISVEVDLRED